MSSGRITAKLKQHVPTNFHVTIAHYFNDHLPNYLPEHPEEKIEFVINLLLKNRYEADKQSYQIFLQAAEMIIASMKNHAISMEKIVPLLMEGFRVPPPNDHEEYVSPRLAALQAKQYLATYETKVANAVRATSPAFPLIAKKPPLHPNPPSALTQAASKGLTQSMPSLNDSKNIHRNNFKFTDAWNKKKTAGRTIVTAMTPKKTS